MKWEFLKEVRKSKESTEILEDTMTKTSPDKMNVHRHTIIDSVFLGDPARLTTKMMG